MFPVALAVTSNKQVGGSLDLRKIETFDPDTVPERLPSGAAPAKLVASTDQVPVNEDPTCVIVRLAVT